MITNHSITSFQSASRRINLLTNDVVQKWCSTCEKVLSLDKFYPDRRKLYGVGSSCKKCNISKVMASQERNKTLDRSTDSLEEKQCHVCKTIRPISYFSRSSRTRDGFQPKCKECSSTIFSSWREENIDRERTRSKSWYADNLKNQLRRKISYALWVKNNYEKALSYGKERRARQRNAPIIDLTRKQWAFIKWSYKNCCAYCRKKSKKLTQDHIIPLIHGGSHTMTNIVPACRSCNSRKHTGPPLIPVQPLLGLTII